MKSYKDWKKINEAAEETRYSVGVNYRTSPDEVLDVYAKISLGYVSAAIKNYGYHTKHVYTETPYRLLISSGDWSDGEWVGVVSWDHKNKCFVISSGFYKKMTKTVSIVKTDACRYDTASKIAQEVYSIMKSLEDKPDRKTIELKPAKKKTGPK